MNFSKGKKSIGTIFEPRSYKPNDQTISPIAESLEEGIENLETTYTCVPIEKFAWQGSEDIFGPERKIQLDSYPSKDIIMEKYKPTQLLKVLLHQGILIPGKDEIHVEEPEKKLNSKDELIDCLCQGVLFIDKPELANLFHPSDDGRQVLKNEFLHFLEFQVQVRTQGKVNEFNLDLHRLFWELDRWGFFLKKEVADCLQIYRKKKI